MSGSGQQLKSFLLVAVAPRTLVFKYVLQFAEIMWFLCCLQDDENALLQQALAMSMDDSSSTAAVRDANMSDASADDHDLQLGENSYLGS